MGVLALDTQSILTCIPVHIGTLRLASGFSATSSYKEVNSHTAMFANLLHNLFSRILATVIL